MICAAFQSPDSLLALGEPSISVDQEPLPELLRLLKWYGIKQGVERFLIGCKTVDHVRELQRQARALRVPIESARSNPAEVQRQTNAQRYNWGRIAWQAPVTALRSCVTWMRPA